MIQSSGGMHPVSCKLKETQAPSFRTLQLAPEKEPQLNGVMKACKARENKLCRHSCLFESLSCLALPQALLVCEVGNL